MALIIDGKSIPNTERIQEDIRFVPGTNKNTKRMKKPPEGIVHHWTGAENPGSTVVNTLLGRNLSVTFTTEVNGDLIQRADIMTRTAHAGKANNRFCGNEVICRGFARREDLQELKKAGFKGFRDREEIDWEEPRDVYTDEIDGRKVNMASFTPEQIDSILYLSETLAGVLFFPRLIPYVRVEDKSNLSERMQQIAIPAPTGGFVVPVFDRDPRWWRGTNRMKTFSGAMGHFHCHKQKFDPGTQPFYALWCEGWNPRGKKLFNWKDLVK